MSVNATANTGTQAGKPAVAVVAATASASRFTVSGDYHAEFVAGGYLYARGTNTPDGCFPIVSSSFAAGATNIIVSGTVVNQGLTAGTVQPMLDGSLGATWAGGIVPSNVGDTAVIPNGAAVYLDFSPDFLITIEAGGAFVPTVGNSGCIVVSGMNYLQGCSNCGTIVVRSGGQNFFISSTNAGAVIVEGGGENTFSGTMGGNNAQVTVEPGGSNQFLDSTENGLNLIGSVSVESGGTNYFAPTAWNIGNVLIESGGDNTIGGYCGYGDVVAFEYASYPNGWSGAQVPFEKRTLHYTAGQSTDTLPLANGGKITLYDSVVVLGLLSPQVSSASIQAVASYKQNPYILIP